MTANVLFETSFTGWYQRLCHILHVICWRTKVCWDTNKFSVLKCGHNPLPGQTDLKLERCNVQISMTHSRQPENVDKISQVKRLCKSYILSSYVLFFTLQTFRHGINAGNVAVQTSVHRLVNYAFLDRLSLLLITIDNSARIFARLLVSTRLYHGDSMLHCKPPRASFQPQNIVADALVWSQLCRSLALPPWATHHNESQNY